MSRKPLFPLITYHFFTTVMRLAADSHRHIEEFHRFFMRDDKLRLPPVRLYNGRVARWLTHAFHIGAITFGRSVFVKPELTKVDQSGRWTVPAWLVVHETTHVLQYEATGLIRFLVSYLRDYWGCLRCREKWDAAARLEAYHAINAEGEAREAEEAYAAWKASRKNDEG